MTVSHTTVARCAALSEPTRWKILERLGLGPASASTISRDLPVSRQAIMRHLTVLAASGLVTAERTGREVVYKVESNELSSLARTLDSIGASWERRLANLKEAAEHPATLEPELDDTGEP